MPPSRPQPDDTAHRHVRRTPHGPEDARARLRYQAIADDLLERLAHRAPPASAASRAPATAGEPLGRLPSAEEIARRYRVPVPTAVFVRRAVRTRLRIPGPAVRHSDSAVRARPVYQTVADDLRHRITSGTLRGRLPTHPELAEQYRVSVDTIGKAVRSLVRTGLLTSSAGSGTHTSPEGTPR